MPESLVIICPDTNFKLWANRVREAALGGGKTAVLQLAAAWARAGLDVTVACADAVESYDGRLRICSIEQAAGKYDVTIYVTGSIGHFNYPAITGIEGGLRIFWINGPARVELPPGRLPDWFIAPARFLARKAIDEWSLPAERVVVIPCGAVPGRSHPADDDRRDPFSFVYASHPLKGLDNAIEVLGRVRAEFPAVRLDVYGSEKLWGDQAQTAPTAALPEWVRLKGSLPQESVERAMGGYGAMLYLTTWVDSFSPVLSEAFAAGVVVIATAHGSNSEVIRHGWNGFLVASNDRFEPDLDQAEYLLRQYLSDTSKYLGLRQRARASVPTWDEQAEQWRHIWQSPTVPASPRPSIKRFRDHSGVTPGADFTEALKEHSDLDVLHLTFFHSKATAVSKVINNLVKNIPGVRQKVISLSEFDLDPGLLINATRPKILHIHFNGQHPESSFLYDLSYRPVIIQTLHTDSRSIFTDIVDKIICLDEPGASKNDARKNIFIENSVDVAGFDKHRPNQNGVCLGLRFSPDQMQKEVFDLFARLRAEVYFYGADDVLAFDADHNRSLREYALGYQNIHCLPYISNMEERMVEHSFLCYYLLNNNPSRAYGLVAMEAASLGMPVVALKRRQLSQQFIIDGYNGLIVDNGAELIEACARLREDVGLYETMCANAQRHCLTLKNSMPESYRGVYCDLLSSGKSAAISDGSRIDSEEVFTEYYRTRRWGGSESLSGPGASLSNTRVIREQLPIVVGEFGIKSLLDIPCGDLNWIKEVELDLDLYIGGDIVSELIESNAERYGARGNKRFLKLDITTDALPQVDMILCRDCLVHLTFDDIYRAIANIKKSQSKYLLATTFIAHRKAVDIKTGKWRPLNFQLPPFNFPDPLKIIVENCTEDDGLYPDKSMALWLVSSLP
jgi:glycosyltransferase involved in cell wall biosynthesis